MFALAHIDPQAWLYLLPLTMGLFWARGLEADHVVKQWWQDMREREAMGWETVGQKMGRNVTAPDLRSYDALLFWFVAGGLALSSAGSLVSWLGLLPL